ncbi:probable cyclic nucleotide-gated ion channel 20, chloroplastic isoform X2 [Salvia splendens]|uniref:probable cyclic nucleotide-gated ion channel 20, chloroplastic isoform X2 n=1 Tax=Salvia splendens TaxID=180675 RepID=UPI001C2756AA|nr:probable cyclic nucleotide-gated ion channel 20, chloroplastic isoform X2 [Salvia splendens]
MSSYERDEIPMLPAAYLQSDAGDDSGSRGLSTRRSASMSVPSNSMDSTEYEPSLVGFTGPLRNPRRAPNTQMSSPLYANRNQEFVFQPPKGTLRQKATEPKLDGAANNDWSAENYGGMNEHLLKSGQLGMCNDPYCTTCPMYYNVKGRTKPSRKTEIFDAKDNKCIVLNWPMTTAMIVLRSMTDFIYLLHIFLQFRLAYVAPESRVAGSGDLVDDPKLIARNYLRGCFAIDFFIVLPLPQIIILLVLPGSIGASGANYAKNLLRAAILIQYIPRLWRFLPLVAGPSPTGFIFESAWANFVINLVTFVLASHVVGSCWYLFGLQRVNQCFRDACSYSNITECTKFIDCGHGNANERFAGNSEDWDMWKNNENASACFGKGGFDFGIYETAVSLTTHRSLLKRYVYSLFWGFQQISTLAGNQVPSYFEWEVLFTMSIIGTGLLLFALLIGNMQNFLQALGRRRLEMSLRRRDVEQWMSHRRLPEDLRRLVRDSERYSWAATRGVNEERLMENLPEDLQREIRCHLFKFVKKVRIFQILHEPIIDAIREKLKTKTYIKGSNIMVRGGLVDKMVFIIRGEMVNKGEDGSESFLTEGGVCGEELLTWCLEHSSVNKDVKRRIPGPRLLSNRKVTCLTNVEAFVLRCADLEEVTSLFARFLKSPRVQGAIRYGSLYWRTRAARQIQVAWKYRMKRINRADSA